MAGIITGPRYLSGSEVRTSGTTQDLVGPLGGRVETLDGRIFRAAFSGGSALVAGNLLQAPAINSKSINIAVSAAAAAGATTVSVTLASSTASENEFADGFMVVNDEAGEGIAYRIGGHPASVSTALTLSLSEPLQVALTTSSEVSLINTFRGAIQSVATTLTGAPIGGADKAYAASNYFWLQTGGAGSVLNGDSAVVNQMLMAGTTAGSVLIADAGDPQVGKAMQAHVSGEHRGIWWLFN